MTIPSSDLVAWSWVLLASGGLALAFFVYRLVWRERYRLPTSAEPMVRIQGQVTGPPGTVVYCIGDQGQPIVSRQFHVWGRDNQRWHVDPSGAVLAIRGYRHGRGRLRGLLAGEMVTIDGVATTFHEPETLYRQSGRTVGIEAVRISGGSWPELRWLRIPMTLAMLAFLFSLAKILVAPGPAPLQMGLLHSMHVHVQPICVQEGSSFRFSVQRSEPNEHVPTLLEVLGNLPLDLDQDRLTYRP